jgi:hypothetical protein
MGLAYYASKALVKEQIAKVGEIALFRKGESHGYAVYCYPHCARPHLAALEAVLAREYRLPAVVGTHVGTTRLRTGQLVDVDGLVGSIRLLEA